MPTHVPRASRSIGLALLLLSAMAVLPQRAAIGGEAGATPAPFLKELYFYPPFSNDALQNLFDPNFIVKNATTDFPVVEGMSSIALPLLRSQLCPVENQVS